MTRLSLFLIRKLSWFYRWLKVDVEQMLHILTVKLKTDNRRVYMNYQPRSSKKQNKNTFTISLLMYIFMSIFIAMFYGALDSIMIATTIAMGMLFFLLIFAMITDFTSILIDTTDNKILLFRPVSPKTLLAARLSHIGSFVLSIGFSLSMIPIIVGIIKHGILFLPAFLIGLSFAILLSIFVTNIFYLLLFRFTTGEKFRDIINYLQIFITLLFMVGYQIIPRLIDFDEINQLTLSFKWWTYAIPSVWFGGLAELLINLKVNLQNLLLSAAAIFFPLTSIYLVFSLLAPNFEKRLSRLELAQRSEKDRWATKKTAKKIPFLCNLLTRSEFEKTAFTFSWRMTAKDRTLKQKIYPVFGMLPVMFFVFVIHDTKHLNIADITANLKKPWIPLLLIYVCGIAIMQAISLISHSDSFRGSWIYYALPVKNPGFILTASLKVVIIKYLLPLFTLVTAFLISFLGLPVIPHLIFGLFNLLLFSLAMPVVGKASLPFSQDTDNHSAKGQSAQIIFIFSLLAIMALGHFLLSSFLPQAFLLLAIPLQAVMIKWLFNRYYHLSWEQIK